MSSFQHKMLRELKPGWDSYDAKAIDPRCIDRAAVLWGQLSGDWQVVPCADGGVQLEQHRDGLDIEITVSPAQETPAECFCGMPNGAHANGCPYQVLERAKHNPETSQ